MRNQAKIFLTFLSVALLVGVPAVSAQSNAVQYEYTAGIARLSTADLEVRVTGANQVPHFHWWDPNNESIDYHMIFLSLFEANDTNDDGVFTRGVDEIVGARFMLPATGWEFSGFATEGEGENVTAVHFNFTTTSEFNPRPGGNYGNLPDLVEFDVMVQIRVHLYTETSGEVKFDVVIDGWNWTYDDSILVLHFAITESDHGEGMPERNPSRFHRVGTRFNFNNAYMQYAEEALALEAQNTLQVKASFGEGIAGEMGESVYLAFEYFGNDTLVYDPVIGISSEDSLTLDLPTLTLLIGGVAIVAIVAIGLKLRK